MRTLALLVASIFLGGLAISCPCGAFDEKAHRPEVVFNVREFGAGGDGKVLDTAAISKAIQAASAAGGGRVVFPPGVYLSGTFELLSNVSLEVQANVVILGSPNLADYRAISQFGFAHVYGENSTRGAREKETLASISLLRGKGVSIVNSRALPGTGTFLRTEEVTGEGLFAINDLREAKRVFATNSDTFSVSENLMPPKP